jgi:hypothetical protein
LLPLIFIRHYCRHCWLPPLRPPRFIVFIIDIFTFAIIFAFYAILFLSVFAISAILRLHFAASASHFAIISPPPDTLLRHFSPLPFR